MSEGNVRILRDIDELKVSPAAVKCNRLANLIVLQAQVMQLRVERKETNKRVSHLEAENKYLRQALASLFNQRQAYHDIIYENERARGARVKTPFGFPNGGARRAHSLNLHYGTVHQAPAPPTQLLDEDDEEEQLQDEDNEELASSKRLSSSSNESRSNGLATPIKQSPQTQPVQSPPKFALLGEQVASTPTPPPLLPRKKEHAQLKRELSEATSARKEANQRIIAWV